MVDVRQVCLPSDSFTACFTFKELMVPFEACH